MATYPGETIDYAQVNRTKDSPSMQEQANTLVQILAGVATALDDIEGVGQTEEAPIMYGGPALAPIRGLGELVTNALGLAEKMEGRVQRLRSRIGRI